MGKYYTTLLYTADTDTHVYKFPNVTDVIFFLEKGSGERLIIYE